MKRPPRCSDRALHRKSLILLRLLNAGLSIRYTSNVPTTRWGEAIAFLLAERGWTQKQLAEAAEVRPNTLTNLIKHGRGSDTATLLRIAEALNVDVGELFLSREQIEVLRAHRENRIDRLKDAVLKEVAEVVSRHVRKELERSDAQNASFAKKPRSGRAKR